MAREIKLLIAESDVSIREVIRMSAAEQGWQCDCVGDGITAMKLIRRNVYQLGVLDTDLPELDGHVICRQLKKKSFIPVIFISKNGREENRLAGFEAGGNDYVVKPFFPRELVARIKNLLELTHGAMQVEESVVAGKIRIETASRQVLLSDKHIRLSPKEYDLLLFFCINEGQAFSRAQLLDLVWRSDFEGTDRTVDTHVKSLRSKLKPYQSYIETVWGFGYRFKV